MGKHNIPPTVVGNSTAGSPDPGLGAMSSLEPEESTIQDRNGKGANAVSEWKLRMEELWVEMDVPGFGPGEFCFFPRNLSL